MISQASKLLIKILIIGLSIIFLYFEVRTYSNTIGSFGEMFSYPNPKSAFHFGVSLVSVFGFLLLWTKKFKFELVLAIIILFIVALFYPIFDMRGIDNSF
jgi:hypothetical protein